MVKLQAVTVKKQMQEIVFRSQQPNLGAEQAEKNAIGFNLDVDGEYGDEEFRRFLAIEFRNRLDGVVTFGKLDKPNCIKNCWQVFT